MRLDVLEAGFVASRLLQRPQAGRVVALFERSCYLALDGSPICLGGPGLGSGPLNLICRLPAEWNWRACGLSLDDPFRSDGQGRLRLPKRVEIVTSGAQVWRPPSVEVADPSKVAGALAALRAEARSLVPDEGFAWCVVATPNAAEPSLLKAADGPLSLLKAWLESSLRGEQGPPPAEIQKLLGLGPGLTPSGDDLLGGAMIALRLLGHRSLAEALFGILEPVLAIRSHAIGAAHLRAAAGRRGGRCPARSPRRPPHRAPRRSRRPSAFHRPHRPLLRLGRACGSGYGDDGLAWRPTGLPGRGLTVDASNLFNWRDTA